MTKKKERKEKKLGEKPVAYAYACTPLFSFELIINTRVCFGDRTSVEERCKKKKKKRRKQINKTYIV